MKPAFSGLLPHLYPKNQILIIDRDGLIGDSLSLMLSEKFNIVFVSEGNLYQNKKNQNIIYIPFSEKFPVIPDEKYSHIVFIDEKGKELDLLPKIIRKVRDINAEFIFAQGLSSEGSYVTEKILKLDSNAKIVLFGDVFSDRIISGKDGFKSTINNYLYQAQKSGKIQIAGEGLKKTYPVFLQDVVGGVADLVNKLHKENSLLYIFPKNPPFELSLAHMIQKMNPEVKIDFAKSGSELGVISYPPNGKYLLRDNYPLAKIIRNIDIKKKMDSRYSNSGKHVSLFKSFIVFVFWTLIFLLLTPFVFTTFFSYLGLGTLYFAKGEIARGNLVNARSSVHLSETLYSLGEQAFSIFSKQVEFVGFKSSLDKLSQDFDSGHETSSGLLQAFYSGEYFLKTMSGKSKNPAEDITLSGNYLKGSIIALDKAKIGGEIPKPILQDLKALAPLIKFLSNVVDIMPEICGINGPRTYLILFQDNMELRPGGGVIAYYGILKFNLGKITEFSVHDVVDADRRLRGHVEPPLAIRRYLAEKHWYLKDSNFDVDFVKSALSSSSLLFAETGQEINDVIAVDTSFIKNILRAVGQVNLTDYKQVVRDGNLPALMQFYARDNNFSKSLNKEIFKKIMSNKANYLLVARAISDSLAQKHLLFSFGDVQSAFSVNGWSSSLLDERKNDKEFINDFLGINEANLGLNKANYFISRQVSQRVVVGDDGSISEELSINYKNQNNTQGTNYKNYLRIILSENTILSEMSINNNPQFIVNAITDPLIFEGNSFKPSQGIEIERTNENGKEIFGFLINVPAGENMAINMKYVLAKNVAGSNAFSYNLRLFKQPGVDSFPYSLTLVYPNSFNAIKSTNGIIKDGELIYGGEIIEDKNIDVNLARK